MRKNHWNGFVIILLILAILVASSGCQAVGGASKGLERLWGELASVPDRLEQALINLFSSIGSVGTALADSFRNMIGNIMGK